MEYHSAMQKEGSVDPRYSMDKPQKHAAAAAKLLQSCPTLCDPIDGSPLGSSVPGIPQARTQEWVAISFSNAWKWKVKVQSLSHARLLATPWTAAYQAPPSMGFSRQEDWSGMPLPSLSKAWSLVKHIVWLCDISQTGQFLETEIAQGVGEGENEGWLLNGHRVFFCCDEDYLKPKKSRGCTALWMS